MAYPDYFLTKSSYAGKSYSPNSTKLCIAFLFSIGVYLLPLLFPIQTSYPYLAKLNAGAFLSPYLTHIFADENNPCYKNIAGPLPFILNILSLHPSSVTVEYS